MLSFHPCEKQHAGGLSNWSRSYEGLEAFLRRAPHRPRLSLNATALLLFLFRFFFFFFLLSVDTESAGKLQNLGSKRQGEAHRRAVSNGSAEDCGSCSQLACECPPARVGAASRAFPFPLLALTCLPCRHKAILATLASAPRLSRLETGLISGILREKTPRPALRAVERGRTDSRGSGEHKCFGGRSRELINTKAFRSWKVSSTLPLIPAREPDIIHVKLGKNIPPTRNSVSVFRVLSAVPRFLTKLIRNANKLLGLFFPWKLAFMFTESQICTSSDTHNKNQTLLTRHLRFSLQAPVS